MIQTSQPTDIHLTLEYIVQSVDALTQIKALKNAKISKEAVEVAQEWLDLKRAFEKSKEQVSEGDQKTAVSKSPLKRIADAISSKNNVFADLK